MNSAEKEAVLHCLRAMIDEELCEECPLYGTTGTDHCEKDCVRLAIGELEKEQYYKDLAQSYEKTINKLTKAISEQKPKPDILDKINNDIQTLRGCSCSCSDGIIDDVEDIIYKYRQEG